MGEHERASRARKTRKRTDEDHRDIEFRNRTKVYVRAGGKKKGKRTRTREEGCMGYDEYAPAD